MALTIVWTPRAEKGLAIVISYLSEDWTSKEILNLEKNLNKLLSQITKYPKICPATEKYKNLHKGLVDKNNYIVYRVLLRKNTIIIVNFRGTKQKPL